MEFRCLACCPQAKWRTPRDVAVHQKQPTRGVATAGSLLGRSLSGLGLHHHQMVATELALAESKQNFDEKPPGGGVIGNDYRF